MGDEDDNDTENEDDVLLPPTQTPYIPIGRGVLQGDCLSPPLFNLCFNTFIQHIKAPEFRQFGFFIDCYKSLSSIHWFQFSDDAAVISGQENENQHLLNRFTIWCKWAQIKGGSRVSSKSSRTQSEVMSHKKKINKDFFFVSRKI